MSEFLLELLSEEIPARMQAKAAADLGRLFGEAVAAAGLVPASIETFATPRRLALIARDLPAATEAVSEEIKGPRTSAPDQALEGFLRKTGLDRGQLVERDGIWFASLDRPGRAATEVIAELVPAIVAAFPWPKSMRWGIASAGAEALRWVRPLQGVVALFGEAIVDFEISGIRSGAATVGHRFHHPGPITIGSAADYVEKLRACHVILDPEERRRIIAEGAGRLAAEAGLALVEDPGLLAENAGLSEWPVPLLGAFDPDFLDVPREVIQLTMRTNQKYFACTDGEGRLAPSFVCVANIEAADGGVSIVAGNRKVLAARLADARYFWEQDLKVPLVDQAGKLDQIVFHEKIGTVAARVDRIARLARWLVQEGIVGDAKAPLATRMETAARVERAARLAKADLVSQMVGEFPELQGIVGGYLARAQGEPDAVADAVRDHYRPVGQGDIVPSDPVTVAVALADKIDSLVAFFAIGEKPTGSRDPFALRRSGLGILQIITAGGLRIPLRDVLVQAGILLKLSTMGALDTASFPDVLEEEEGDHEISAEVGSFTYRFGGRVGTRWDSERTPNLERGRMIEEVTDLQEEVFAFLADRLKVQQREAGIRHDMIDAVFATGGEDDVVRLLARVNALQAFVESPDGADLLTGYRRAANILRKEGWQETRRQTFFSYPPLPEEDALDSALDAAEPRARAALADEDFEGAMAALAALRPAVDAFFDHVTVNDPDLVKRETRLVLLDRMREAVEGVADFSRIEG
jgi:glycyl-tRNA synthetase beta chain